MNFITLFEILKKKKPQILMFCILKEIELNRVEAAERRGRINSDEFVSLFKEISTRPEIYFLLVR